MNIGVIIKKNPGQIVPRGYLETALKQCPNVRGITIQDKDGEDPVLESSGEAGPANIDNLVATIEKCKDVLMYIWLSNADGTDFDKETDGQPFVFQQKAGDGVEDILAFYVEGDLPNYAKPGKGHTDEYNFWESFVYPTILEKFEASADLADFFSRLRSSQFEQALMNPVNHRAAFAFIPLEGDPIEFGRNELGSNGEFEWGETSNKFGWGNQSSLEKAAETVVSVAKKAGGRLARIQQAMSSTASPPVVPEAPKTNPPGVHNTADVNKPKDGVDVFAKWPGTSSKTHTMVAVPEGLQGNARNRWIRTFLGLDSNADLPKGKDVKGFQIPVPLKLIGFSQEEVSTNDEVKMLADKVKKFRSAPSSVTANQQMQEANETIDNEVKNPQKPAATPQADPNDWLPESPAEEAKIAAELVTEWATNPKAPTALEVQRIESKWPLFTVSRGIKLEDVARWSMKEKKDFAKKCPNDAARLISELILKLHEHGGFEQVNTEKQNDKPDHKTQPQQVEVPSPKPAAPAAKSGRLARLNG